MTENQDPNPTADVQAPDAADTHGTTPAAETHPSSAAPETDATADPPPADQDARPASATVQDPDPATEKQEPASAAAGAEPNTSLKASEPAAAESEGPAEMAEVQEKFGYTFTEQEAGRQDPAAGESERRDAGRAEAPRETRDLNAGSTTVEPAAGNPQRITIQRHREPGAATPPPEKAPEATEKRITFGIRRDRNPAAVVEEAKQWDDHFPLKQTVVWQPNTRGGAKGSNGKAEGREVAVVVTQEVLLSVSQHVAQTLEHEVGGFLIGDHCRCPETGREYIVINNTSPARMADATEVSHNFTVESWQHLNAELKGKFRGKLLVGWYHSHPRMDVFLSRYDMDIQSERFAEPWMTALVLEPERHRGGFFGWRGGSVNPTEPIEFFELLERNSRESVVAWENYNGFDPVQLQRPPLKTRNTLTVSTPEQFPEPEAVAPAPPVNSAQPPAVIVAPPPPTRTKRLLPWLIGAAALLLGFASVFAFFRMQDDPEENINGALVAEATPTPASGQPQPAEEAGIEVIPVEPVTISKLESYELVKGRENTFRVRMLVDHAPSRMQVELGERKAKVTGIRKVAGAENRREVLATVSFAREVELMKRRPDAPLPLLVKVSDEADPENYEIKELEVEPAKLGLEDTNKPAPKGPVAIDSGKTKDVGRGAGRPRRVTRPRDGRPTRPARTNTAPQLGATPQERREARRILPHNSRLNRGPRPDHATS